MASGIFTILDDIAALMDDVAVATKVATRKTAAILGDDLAVNAEKATGFVSSRELPVLWAITKGSFINKLMIVPVALVLNAYLPVVVTGMLLIGGLYLAYEGAEKIVHVVLQRRRQTETRAVPDIEESSKIRSAITTDFILSIEIVIIALGAVGGLAQTVQIMAVSAVALIATVGVYGLVALIVRLDDIGLRLIHRSGGRGITARIGSALVAILPHLIRVLSIVGTIALLLVSGGIFTNHITVLQDMLPEWPSIVRDLLTGLGVGLLAVLGVSTVQRLYALLIRR